MIVYNHKVFGGAITGTASVYTSASMSAELGRAARWFCTVRASEGRGTVPRITIAIEHSCDDVHWEPYASTPLMDAVQFNPTQVDIHVADERGTSRTPGAFIRLRVALSADSGTPGGTFEIWLCGRDDL